MVLDKIRKALRKNPDSLQDDAKLEHCNNCDGDCPLIDGCC